MKKLLSAIQVAGVIGLFLAAGASDAGSLSLGWTAIAAAMGSLAVAAGFFGGRLIPAEKAAPIEDEEENAGIILFPTDAA